VRHAIAVMNRSQDLARRGENLAMVSRRRIVDFLAAASIVIAFGGLFFGRLMIYPVAAAQGTFLERVAAEATAWDIGHRVMLVGMIGLIPAALAIRRACGKEPGWLADVAMAFTIVGAALGVGQYALDFAMLAAAEVGGSRGGDAVVTALRGSSFVDWAFYKLPDLSQLGLLLFTVVLWRLGRSWRLQAIMVTLAALTSLIGPQVAGAAGIRVALGLAFVGFSTVAWKIAFDPQAEGQSR
jgi:hypothetical protein